MLKRVSEGNTGPHHFSIVLLPDFSLLTLTALIEALHAANRLEGRDMFRWSLHSGEGQAVMSSGGFALSAPRGVHDVDLRAAIVLCGGPAPAARPAAAVDCWLRRAARQAPMLIGLEGAVWLMARCGLLDQRKAAVHWELVDGFRETFADVEVSAQLFEADRGRMTCAGGAAVIDMAIALIAKVSGPEIARGVAEHLIHGRVRPGDEQQVSAILRYSGKNSFLVRTIEIMEENLEFPLDLEAIARRAGCSRRQIERVFHRFVGISPAAFYRNLRLDRGRRLLAETRLSCIEIALACGFRSQGTFCRSYQQRFGATPFMDRGRSKTRMPFGWNQDASRESLSVACGG